MLCINSSASIEYDSPACGTLLCACHTVIGIGIVRGRMAPLYHSQVQHSLHAAGEGSP